MRVDPKVLEKDIDTAITILEILKSTAYRNDWIYANDDKRVVNSESVKRSRILINDILRRY